MKKTNKWEEPVDIICYYDLTTFSLRRIAKDFYFRCMSACEGAERDRYTNIYMALISTNSKMVHDGTESNPIFWRISKYDEKDDCCKENKELPRKMSYAEYQISQKEIQNKFLREEELEKD